MPAVYTSPAIQHQRNRHGDVEACVRHKVPLVITSLRPPREVVEAVHSYGGLLFHDIISVKHARKAAEQGNGSALTSLGVMYERGIGVPQDDSEAVSLLHKAAEQGHGEALYLLGGIYERGQGAVKVDLEQAHKWFSIAVAAGFEIAHDNLEEIEVRMSREQIENARSMAKEWLATHKLPAISVHLK